MSKTLKKGYIALCFVSILNFIYDNYTVIARTHIGQTSGGLLGKVYDFIVGLDGVLLILSMFLPLIVSIIVSVIVFVFYRKSLTKPTAVLATFGFIPYLLFNISTFGLGVMTIIALGIIKIVYAIIMIVFMLKDIKRLSV